MSTLMLDHLRAAQADAQRFHGAGPVAAWQPRRPGWMLPTAAAVATALAALLLARPAPEPAPVAAAEGRRDVAPAVPVLPAPISLAGSVVVPTAPATPAAVAASTLLPYGAAAATPEAPPSDGDDGALHPAPVAAPDAAALQRPLFNTPMLPDEAAPLHADELPAADDTGGGTADEAQPG